MKKLFILFFGMLIIPTSFGQSNDVPKQAQIMTLGVFHFAYHNLDVVKTEKKDQISVLDEPYQSEIIEICKAIEEFKPNKIAIEALPAKQYQIDSLYSLYKSDRLTLDKDEIYQLAFRIGKNLNLPQIYCVNDWGKHYATLEALFDDSIRSANFEDYYLNSPDSVYKLPKPSGIVNSIVNELIELNDPQHIKDRLSVYLLTPFKYEEQNGDFIGVDFETGRWFNRNLRIFRNLQRITSNPDDRILLIIGAEHINLLNYLFDVSKEFDLVTPLPYLENAKIKIDL
ncbi:MAG: hypothetical protein KKG99_07915 [Bacteroidetes bacterium]|nr:hypothetical protein [Bacteroidota bacterium]